MLAEGFEEGQELPPAFAFPDPVDHLPGRQVEGSEHVPHAVVTVVGGAQPGWVPVRLPGAAGPRLQVQRPELIGADHPAIGGRVVVKAQHATHLGDEVRVAGGFPGLGSLPADAPDRRIWRTLSRLIEATTPVATR